MSKSSSGMIIVQSAFRSFLFKSLADERIRPREALAEDCRTSFLGNALLKAVLHVCSAFAMHKIVHLVDGLDSQGIQFFFCLQLSSSE